MAATVSKFFLWDGDLAPLTSWWKTWNNLPGDPKAHFFYAVPTISNQSHFPQKIEIKEVQIQELEEGKWRARILLYNPTQPANIPQVDGCHYAMYMVSVQ
jgi:hypothetical protein